MDFKDFLDFGDTLTFVCLVGLQVILLAIGVLVFFAAVFA
jgi:hypothetical protein